MNKDKTKKVRKVKLKEFTFNFESSGWNTIWAKTKKGAIKAAKERYKDSPMLNPDEKSFRIASAQETEQLMSLFW